MKRSALPILLLASCAAAEPQEVYVPPPEPAPLANLAWKLPAKYATLEGDRLVVDIPTNAYPASAVATAKLPAELFEGSGGFLATVSAEGENLARPTKTWLGLKFQMHWKETASGREAWPNCRNRIGDFSATVLTNDASFGDARPDSIELELGLQGAAGRVVFDLSTLRGAPSQGFFRRINRGWIVRYPDDPAPNEGLRSAQNEGRGVAANEGFRSAKNEESSLPPQAASSFAAQPHPSLPAEPASSLHHAAARREPRRGVMLPGRDPTEEDFAALAEWGATLVRYQMVRNWFGVGDNRDLDECAAWLDGRLDRLEKGVLPCARKHGMKVVGDLHVTPGGRDASHEPLMFHEKKYADAFVDTWRRIATRFKGNADAIYGYDLVNEPFQHGRAPFDYWSLQRRAAEAVREIDPVTPIVFEANDQDTPSGFAYLSPLAMDNVVYQVHCYAPPGFTHQGVGAFERGTKWPDPEKGWDKEYVRRALEPVREFEKRHHARIYVGEFSAIAWAEGADRYIADCIEIFEEYGWDWTYHAFREWNGWSVEHEGPDDRHMVPSSDNPRKRALLDGLRGVVAPPAGR